MAAILYFKSLKGTNGIEKIIKAIISITKGDAVGYNQILTKRVILLIVYA